MRCRWRQLADTCELDQPLGPLCWECLERIPLSQGSWRKHGWPVLGRANVSAIFCSACFRKFVAQFLRAAHAPRAASEAQRSPPARVPQTASKAQHSPPARTSSHDAPAVPALPTLQQHQQVHCAQDLRLAVQKPAHVRTRRVPTPSCNADGPIDVEAEAHQHSSSPASTQQRPHAHSRSPSAPPHVPALQRAQLQPESQEAPLQAQPHRRPQHSQPTHQLAPPQLAQLQQQIARNLAHGGGPPHDHGANMTQHTKHSARLQSESVQQPHPDHSCPGADPGTTKASKWWQGGPQRQRQRLTTRSERVSPAHVRLPEGDLQQLPSQRSLPASAPSGGHLYRVVHVPLLSASDLLHKRHKAPSGTPGAKGHLPPLGPVVLPMQAANFSPALQPFASAVITPGAFRYFPHLRDTLQAAAALHATTRAVPGSAALAAAPCIGTQEPALASPCAAQQNCSTPDAAAQNQPSDTAEGVHAAGNVAEAPEHDSQMEVQVCDILADVLGQSSAKRPRPPAMAQKCHDAQHAPALAPVTSAARPSIADPSPGLKRSRSPAAAQSGQQRMCCGSSSATAAQQDTVQSDPAPSDASQPCSSPTSASPAPTELLTQTDSFTAGQQSPAEVPLAPSPAAAAALSRPNTPGDGVAIMRDDSMQPAACLASDASNRGSLAHQACSGSAKRGVPTDGAQLHGRQSFSSPHAAEANVDSAHDDSPAATGVARESHANTPPESPANEQAVCGTAQLDLKAAQQRQPCDA